MSRRSRQRKSKGQHLPEAQAGKTVALAAANHKHWQIAAVCLILAVVTVFAYRGVRSNGFVTYDDDGYLLQNRHVQQGLTAQSVAWAFTTFDQSNWHPLTWISHIVDWRLYGSNPYGHHMTNVGLHAANAVLLFLLLIYMTDFLGRSAMVALLFALHPAHVESVAWIAERKDLLCAFFFLATLLAYAWYLHKPSWKRFAFVVCGFACALMSKPMAVTLPFTMLLLDYWPLRRITFSSKTRTQWLSSLGKLCAEKWLLFVMAFLSSVTTFIAQRSGGSVGDLQSMPLWVRICNAAISYCRYVRIMVWPDPLTAFYYHERSNLTVSAALLSIIALILITAACWRFSRQAPYCFIGWLWFLGTLVPVIGIVQVGDQAMAERYTYLPFIGLFIAVVWLAGDAIQKFPKMKIAAQLLAVAVIALCVVKTQAQVKVWKDSVTLFSHALAVDPRGELPNSFLGIAYMRQGKYAEAEEYFARALDYNPTWFLPLSCSAFCIMRTNDRSELPLAGQRLELALRDSPNNSEVLTNLALWSDLMGRPKDEETYSRKAIAASQDSIRARIYLSIALEEQGKLDQAIEENRKTLLLDPTSSDAHNNLGAIYGKQGLMQEAVKEYRLSLAILPDQAIIHSKIGRILAGTHQLPEAAEEFDQALRLDPANAFEHNDLGVVYFQMGDYKEAAEQFGDAARLDPAFADAQKNLDLVQAQMKIKSRQ